MGDAVKSTGNFLSSTATGGLYSTSGKGLAQGGSFKDMLNDKSFGLAGKVMNQINPDIDVPGAQNRPEWQLSGADGKLRSDLMLGNEMPKAFDQSQGVLDRLQANAMSEGPSKQAGYLQDANNRSMQNNLNNAEGLGRGQMAAMSGQLAMRGGLDSGARERMAKSTGNEMMMNKQRIMNDASGANLNILANDEAQKQQSLQALPANLLAQAGMQQGNKQFDISNTLGTLGNKYQQDMGGWAANQAAREQAQLANKNKGMLGLGIMGL